MNTNEKATTQLLSKAIIAYFAIPGTLLLFAGLMMLIFPLRETPPSSEEIQTLIVVPQIIFLMKYKFYISLFIPTFLASLYCFLPGRKLTNILRAFGIFVILHIAIPLLIDALVLGADADALKKGLADTKHTVKIIQSYNQ